MWKTWENVRIFSSQGKVRELKIFAGKVWEFRISQASLGELYSKIKNTFGMSSITKVVTVHVFNKN